jgi:AhpD family alkylhydroperoxidase
MNARLDYAAAAPDAMEAMRGLEKVIESSTLEPRLLELLKVRASQINGCAYCVDMHTKDARAIGEDEQRLHLVAVWREAPSFTPRERAALAWTEALTLLPETGAPDDVYEAMAREFDPPEQVALTLAIVVINGWNRFSVGFRTPVGSYVSHRSPEPVNDDEPPSVRLERINPSMAMDASADPVVRPSDERVEHVAWPLRANNIEAIVVDTGAEARHFIVELVPEGAEVHTAVSKALEDIGLFAELHESGRFDALRPRYYGGPGTARS